MRVVVAVRLAVGGDVHELGMPPGGVEPLEQTVEEPLAVIEEPLEGDVAGSVVATSSTTSVTAPNIVAGKRLSDVLQDYLSPAAPSAAWTTRAKTFLTMNGGTVV